MKRQVVALSLLPLLGHAGVTYSVAVRPVDQTNLALASPDAQAPAAVVTRYFADGGKVRVGSKDAKTAYLFADHTVYVLDDSARSAHVLKHATLSEAAAHYVDIVTRLVEAAAAAPPDQRAAAAQKAADMQAASDRLRQPVLREYRVTVRFESVDGHACRIWEERESGAKRLELCVAPPAGVPGGADILHAMKILSEFRQGSDVALGVDFGLSEWWRDFAGIGGVPLLIREYKYDSEVQEVMFTAVHAGVTDTALLEVPAGYQMLDGPEYVQWYLR